MLLIRPAGAILVVGALLILGIRSWGALLGFGIVTLATLTTLIEFGRGTRARMRSTGENAWAAFTTLVARNRRAYGGYIIHLAVVLMTIGIIGSHFFSKETAGRLKLGEQLTLGRYVLTYDGLGEFKKNN